MKRAEDEQKGVKRSLMSDKTWEKFLNDDSVNDV
jgi:hypothetical protein